MHQETSSSPVFLGHPTRWPSGHFLTAVGLFWMILLAVTGLYQVRVALIVTLLLIAINFGRSLHALFRESNLLVPLGLVQVGLFTFAQAQLYHSFGPVHHTLQSGWRSSPSTWSWFSLVHSLHLADPLDLLEEFRVYLHPVKPASSFSRAILTGLYLYIALFLSGLIKKASGPIKEWLLELNESVANFVDRFAGDYSEPSAGMDRFRLLLYIAMPFLMFGLMIFSTRRGKGSEVDLAPALGYAAFGIFLGITVVFAAPALRHVVLSLAPGRGRFQAILRLGLFGLAIWIPCFIFVAVLGRWALRDWALFPVANLVKVIDVADVLSTQEIRLHGVADGTDVTILAAFTRVLWVCLLIEPLSRLIKIRGVKEVHLEKAAMDPDPAVRLRALEVIRQKEEADTDDRRLLIELLDDDDVEVRQSAVQALHGLGKKAEGELLAASNDERFRVRTRAEKLLEQLRLPGKKQ